MFQPQSHGSGYDIFSVVRAMNAFLEASGHGQKHMIMGRASTDPVLGEHADIAVLDDNKAPSEAEQAVIVAGLQQSLSVAFRVEVNTDDKPEFLRTVEGRIPTRGSRAFERLNPEANARYIKLAGL